jgi:hypothetical protein
MAHEPQAAYVQAPELFYDDAGWQFLIVWASTILPNYYQSFHEPTNNNPRLWVTTTRDFETFTQARPFFEPGYSVKDGVIIKDGSSYALIHKDNRMMMENLRVAFAETPLGPWGQPSDLFTNVGCESPCVLKFGDEWLIYYQMYENHQCGAVKTRDFRTFTDVTEFLSFPQDLQYGAVFTAPSSILENLQQRSELN